jgi:hypothetical protein
MISPLLVFYLGPSLSVPLSLVYREYIMTLIGITNQTLFPTSNKTDHNATSAHRRYLGILRLWDISRLLLFIDLAIYRVTISRLYQIE